MLKKKTILEKYPCFDVVVAVCSANSGIGCKGQLPWTLKRDLAFFKQLTLATIDKNKKNVCIMGRRTYLSIPKKFRPLSGRTNIVLSKDKQWSREILTERKEPESLFVLDGLLSALEFVSIRKENVESVFVIGGGEVYREVLSEPLCYLCRRIYMTKVYRRFDCDTFFPQVDTSRFILEKPETDCELLEEDGIQYRFLVYRLIA